MAAALGAGGLAVAAIAGTGGLHAQAAEAVAVSPPRTGADVPCGDAALLVLTGAGLLGGARRLRRRRCLSRG